MSRLSESLKSARKIEILILVVFLCTLLLIGLKGREEPDTGDEARMREILSRIEGAGRVSVMLSKDAEGNFSGAVVAAEGADDIRVMLEIERAVRTLTGIPIDKIEVVKAAR